MHKVQFAALIIRFLGDSVKSVIEACHRFDGSPSLAYNEGELGEQQRDCHPAGSSIFQGKRQGPRFMDRETITIVSGLPRSGTSMMMRMLEAGGMQILTDGTRTADEDNPQGYFEFEKVKQIEHNSSWLQGARGKAVKMISALLKYLPQGYNYKVIFMHRKMEEILASQRQMLVRREEPTDAVSDERMSPLFRQHLEQVEAWIDKQPNIEVVYVSYNDILARPIEPAERINQFLGNTLNVEKMVSVVDRTLYRQRQ
jgi:hypothetical protein